MSAMCLDARSPLVRPLIAALILLVGVSATEADDEVPYRRYTVQEGLPHESIRSLDQGPGGRLWIGTQGGLAVYDGHDIRAVDLPDSVASAPVTNLHTSASGTTWGGVQNEGIVSIHRGEVARTLPWPEGATEVKRLLSRRDTLFVVTTRALWVLPPEADFVQKHPYDYPIETGALSDRGVRTGHGVRDADFAPDGALWIVDAKRGPGTLSLDGSVAFVDSSLVLGTEERWRGLRFGRSGEALLSGTPGLFRLDPWSGRHTRVQRQGLSGGTVYGDTFYGVRQNRVVQWSPTGTQSFGPEQGLPRTIYHSVLRDDEDGLWVGTADGLLHLPVPNVRYVDRIDGTDLRWVTSIGVDPTRGELWALGWKKGLFRLWPRPTHVSLDGTGKWSLSVDRRDGGFHAVGKAGWLRRTTTGWDVVNETIAALHGGIRRNGVGYFQTDEALLRARPDRTAEPDTLWRWPRADRAYYGFALAPNGDVLLRSRGALLRFPPGTPGRADTVAAFPEYGSVGGRNLRVSNGTVYLGLNRVGVLGIDLQAPSDPTVDLVLAEERIKKLTAQGDSLVFVGTTEGLHVIDARSNRVRRHLTAADGLAARRTGAARLYRDTLYVGHETGLSKLPRAVLDESRSPPTTILTRWNVENTSRAPVDSARLAADQRTVGFDFTGVHLTRGRDVRYAYRLVPYDPTWTETQQSFTRYTELPPGTHTFEVKTQLAEGPAGNTARMTFTIPEAYYETAWFRGLVVLGFLGLLGGAYAWRVRALRRRQRKLQRLVDERTRRLAKAKETTERQAERLEALDAEKSRFFANVSHELRTPLTVLRGSIEDLLAGTFGEVAAPIREQLEIMRSNVERLRRLTGQLFDLAQLETTEPTLEPRPRDLVALLRRVTRQFTPLAERRGLRLTLDTEVGTHPCRLDPEKVEKIAGNLLSNALKHTPEGGRVAVHLAVGDGTPPDAVVRVTDTGAGIPPAQQEKIFERFARGSGAATDPDGSGIGLALAREYVELHGGTIEVESTPGEGSTFTVRLPLPTVEPGAVGDSSGPDSGREAEPEPGVSAPSGDGVSAEAPDRPVLLVVEDNDDVRAYLRRHLADDYHLVEAEDGAEGLGTAQASEPDLILTDLMMPGMGGIELCRRVREGEDLARTPIVLLTARADEDDAVAALEAGADAHVTKPFSIDTLRARLARLLEAHWAGARDDGTDNPPSPDVEATAADEQFLDRVTTAIDDHLSHADFTVDDLAAEVGLSPRQLQRKLKRITGTTPAAFVRRYRLDVAAQLLEQEAGTVSEVAYEVGFGTPKTFARRFKERFGCPPSKYPEASSADAPE